ncbi:MAG: hypothetical protein A2X94_17735 [Bdellovibrionales bacterium GWB1_55_8]|nr:MAG: hypothetical protein A2X94_17735 [Bdellovibrionales bacterium GWB1_55_8]
MVTTGAEESRTKLRLSELEPVVSLWETIMFLVPSLSLNRISTLNSPEVQDVDDGDARPVPESLTDTPFLHEPARVKPASATDKAAGAVIFTTGRLGFEEPLDPDEPDEPDEPLLPGTPPDSMTAVAIESVSTHEERPSRAITAKAATKSVLIGNMKRLMNFPQTYGN